MSDPTLIVKAVCKWDNGMEAWVVKSPNPVLESAFFHSSQEAIEDFKQVLTDWTENGIVAENLDLVLSDRRVTCKDARIKEEDSGRIVIHASPDTVSIKLTYSMYKHENHTLDEFTKAVHELKDAGCDQVEIQYANGEGTETVKLV